MRLPVPLTPVVFLERNAAAFPHRSALVCADKEVSFSQLLHRTRRLSQVLRQLKCQGERVAFLAGNGMQAVEAHFAVPGAGAVLVMLNPWLSAADIHHLLDFSEAKVLIADEHHYRQLSTAIRSQIESVQQVLIFNTAQDSSIKNTTDYEVALAKVEGDRPLDADVISEHDPISINFTSGTTGRPKGVMYSHRAAYLHALGQVLMLGLSRKSRYLWTLPMFHVNGWGHIWACTAAACRQTIPSSDFTDRTAEFIEAVRLGAITHLAGAPRLLRTLTETAGASSALRGVTVMTGGSAPSPLLIQQLEGLGIHLIHQYGLNETCGPFVVCEEQDEWRKLSPAERAQRRSRQGVPALHAGTGVRVVDESGRPVVADGVTVGEVVMTGNTVAEGYFKNPEATENAFRDGWFHSGDMAVVHDDGSIEIRDRIKDLIYVETEYGWENISSIEIENHLTRHPAIRDAAVVAIADPECTHRSPTLCAFVETKESKRLSEPEFTAYCLAEFSSYKRPQVVFFTQLPKTSTGKVRKDLLLSEAKQRLYVVATSTEGSRTQKTVP